MDKSLTITPELSAGVQLSIPFRFETPVRIRHAVRVIGGSLGAYATRSPGA